MIEARPNTSVENANETPEAISVSMLLKDLANGIGKKGMCEKYNVKKWELDEVFKHSSLKGKRPAHVKKLSFTFVDDTGSEPVIVTPSDLMSTSENENIEDIPGFEGTTDQLEEITINPNQVTLEQAIDDAIEVVENVKAEMVETERTVLDILNPTEFDTDHDDLEIPTMGETLDLVKEQEMEAGVEVEVEEDEFDSFQL